MALEEVVLKTDFLTALYSTIHFVNEVNNTQIAEYT